MELVNGTQGNELQIDSASWDRRKYSEVAFKLQMEDDSSAFTIAPSKHPRSTRKMVAPRRSSRISECGCSHAQRTPFTKALTFRGRKICLAKTPSASISTSWSMLVLMTRLRNPLRYNHTLSLSKNRFVEVVGLPPVK